MNLMVLYRSYLYGAVLDKPKQSVAVAAQSKPGKAGAGAGAVTQQGLSKARVVKTETSASVLSDLVTRWHAFKDDVRQVRLHCRSYHYLKGNVIERSRKRNRTSRIVKSKAEFEIVQMYLLACKMLAMSFSHIRRIEHSRLKFIKT